MHDMFDNCSNFVKSRGFTILFPTSHCLGMKCVYIKAIIKQTFRAFKLVFQNTVISSAFAVNNSSKVRPKIL